MTTLADIAGSKDLVERIKKQIVEPFRSNSPFSRRVLIYGPPGTGKTFVAKAIAGELGLEFRRISPADTAETIMGVVNSATPRTLVFVDEIDKAAYRPLLSDALQAIPKGILVVGASNYPWKLRGFQGDGFENLVFMPEPDYEARKCIWGFNCMDKSGVVDVGRLAELSIGFMAVDINRLCEWVLSKGSLSQESLEAAIMQYKTTQFDEWLIEAKANVVKLDSASYAPFVKWLDGL